MMQKRIIIAALVAAIALPIPVWADTSNVIIYGVADVSWDHASNGDVPGGTAYGTSVNKISSNTSFVGFKGEEDMGGGLKAVWQVESEVDLDGTTPTGAAANNGLGTRNTFAGLKSDSVGSLILGRHDTPYKTSTLQLDLFGAHIADNRALMGGGAGRGSGRGFASRVTDIVLYNSPVINGFKATAAYVAGAENATLATQSKGSIWSLAGTYDVAPFYGTMAYERHYYGDVGTGVLARNANGASPTTSEKAWKLGGGYKVDEFILNAIFERTDDDFGGGAAAGGPANLAGGCASLTTGASCYGHRAFYVAGQYNITPSDAVKLAYTKADNLQNGTADTGAKHVSVGYDHKMSKRTNLYATYTRLSNDTLAQYDLKGESMATGNVNALGKGASPSAFSLGVRHTF